MDPPIQKHTPVEWLAHVAEFYRYGVDPYNSFDAPMVWARAKPGARTL